MVDQIHTHTNNLQKPTLFFLVGLMGCGKTYWGKLLAKKNNFNFIDLDKAIEQHQNMAIAEIFDSKGQLFFREKETEILQLIKQNASLEPLKNVIISTGGGTACFNNNITWMNQNGITIWLNESIEKIECRVYYNKQKRPLLNTVADKDLLDYLDNLLQTRQPYYSQSKYSFCSSQISETNLQNLINLYV